MTKMLGTFYVIALSTVFYTAESAPMMNLFSDHRAMRVDDILTILIDESAKAGSESGTKTSKENSLGLESPGGSGALSMIPGFGVSGGSKVGYDGKGGTTREGSLVATISARVTKVLDNGNLVIEGSKVVVINDEKEIIKLTGVVRPQDVRKNNEINSSNIADAEITYAGKGVANTGRRPGILARFLNWIF
jgi:flagellar L-ring protein precursor FlgH